MEFFKSRVGLVLLGICLGWLARLLLGPPPEDLGPPRTIERPIKSVAEEVANVSVMQNPGKEAEIQSGLVPPLKLPGTYAIFESSRLGVDSVDPFLSVWFDDYSHDESAMFEAHGEQLCASGCAVSRHPTATLTRSKFERLLRAFAQGPMDGTHAALEELVYFGPQTRNLIESAGVGELNAKRAAFLWDQLTFTHARVSIRVKDEHGKVRTWIDPTRVPFDRRHVFKMQTSNIQPLVTSGTVKRVGLNHLWARL